MPKKKHVVSFSGGKDSTALLLIMLEKKMKIDEIVFIDSTVEFPGVYEHIEKVEKNIGRKITKLSPPKSYEYYLGEHVKKNGQVGYGFPDFKNRWCTQLFKKAPMKRYFKGVYGDIIEYHGIACDESQRALNNKENKRDIRYPLIDWRMTEKDCLAYCYSKGYDWGGLYGKFDRLSCWCCPLKRIGELRVLYNDFPELWAKLKEMDKKSFRVFRMDYTVDELEYKFKNEYKNQLSLF